MKITYLKLIAFLLVCALINSCDKDELYLQNEYQTEVIANLSSETSSQLDANFIPDLHYGIHPEQSFDILLPQGRSSEETKVIILLHGGGWMHGDKAGMQSVTNALHERLPNHAIVSMNYVLATESGTHAFPNQFYDIGRLLDHLTDEMLIYQIKPEFGLIGNSAGGHLAMEYDYSYDFNDRVKFVGSKAGPTDFTHSLFVNDPEFAQNLETLVDENADYINEIPNGLDFPRMFSPLHRVSNNSSPTMLFYGENDTTVPMDNAYDLQQKLTDLNIPVSLSVYPEGHSHWANSSKESMYDAMAVFINTHFPI